MQKTRKAIAKRFKVSASGKLIRRSANRRHLLRHKSTKQRRKTGQDQVVPASHTPQLKRALPFGA